MIRGHCQATLVDRHWHECKSFDRRCRMAVELDHAQWTHPEKRCFSYYSANLAMHKEASLVEHLTCYKIVIPDTLRGRQCYHAKAPIQICSVYYQRR